VAALPGNNGGSNDAELLRIVHRYELAKLAVLVVLGLPGIALEILACVPVAHALAGKHTTLTISISLVVSIALTASLAVTGLVFRAKTRRQGDELRRLRERSSRLEADNDRYQAELARYKIGGD
jgi:hypothetical protein